MGYMKHARRRTVGSDELVFIRCDKDGNIIPDEQLKSFGITNSTIEHIVSDVAGRISSSDESGDGSFSKEIITG